MIASLSAFIEAGATSLANALLFILPFLPASLAEQPEQIMVIVGFAGQGLFAMRFILQWLTSEGHGRSVIPVAFWYFSVGGGSVLLTHLAARPCDYLRSGARPFYLFAEFIFYSSEEGW